MTRGCAKVTHPGHLWYDAWAALSGPLSTCTSNLNATAGAPTQGPLWGYSKVNLQQTCQLWTTISRKMAPRTRKRLQERGRDAPTKGLLWDQGMFTVHISCRIAMAFRSQYRRLHSHEYRPISSTVPIDRSTVTIGCYRRPFSLLLDSTAVQNLFLKTRPRQALRTLSQCRSWGHCVVLGAISWAFIAKSYQNLQKLTFD